MRVAATDKPQIVVTEVLDEASVDRLAVSHSVCYDATLVDKPEDLRTVAADAIALVVRNLTVIDKPLLDAATHLKCIGRLGVGLDTFDLPACERANVTVYPAYGANADSVAEYVINGALALLRPMVPATARVLAGEWPRAEYVEGNEMTGKTLGLIGCGSIGSATARSAMAMGMKVIAYDVAASGVDGVTFCSLDDLLSKADIISLHTPLTDETRHLINADALAKMKRSAILVNTARGPVVDEQALAQALANEQIAGAVLDVFEQEPATADSLAHFQNTPNLILTPHIAGRTQECNARVSQATVDAVLKHLADNS